MARSPQSRFIEGSMNDRASNAPPPDYLGPDAEGTPEYERQFALDWKAPDWTSSQPGNRSSLNSSSSSTSTAPASSRGGSAWIKGHKQAMSSTSGFLAPLWGGVKERLSLTRSKSSNIIPGLSDSAIDDDSSGHFVPPTFKQRRSESTNTANIIRAKTTPRQLDTGFLSPGNESPKLKKAPSVATLPAGGINGPTTYDPSKRPTREEIQASYQSLLASGFFGNRAIQSTRFAPPGQNQNRSSQPASPSIAARVSDNGQDESLSLPPPQRQAPPPPPGRMAPRPHGPSMDSKSPSSSPTRTPTIETLASNPISKDTQASWSMPPPPSPPKRRILRHKPSMSFSSMLLSSNRHPDESRQSSRGFRPPPLSHTRYSFDSGRRSFDVQRDKDPDDMRGLKRTFTATNDSFMLFSGRPYSDIISNVKGEKAVTLTEDSGHESGARKLVKKLRKSASRLSIDLGRTISRPTSIFSSDGDVNGSGPLSPTREPLSAVILRSFSWRSAKPGPEAATPEPKVSHDNSNNRKGTGLDVGGVVTPDAAPKITIGGRYLAPSLSVITGSPSSPDRNKLKKREIRGRRWQRQSISRSPCQATQQSPIVTPTRDRDTTMENTMDWQSSTPTRPLAPAGGSRKQSRSRSRSRPRRSSTTMFMHNQSRPGTAQSTDSCVSQTSNANHSHSHSYSHHNHQQQNYQHHPNGASFSFGSTAQPRRSAEIDSESAAAAADCMEGVEFVVPSFHFPGRVRPGVPLAVVPDANRGIPSVPNIPGGYRDAKAVGVNVSGSGRGENSLDAMAIDGGGGGGAWCSPQVLF